MRTVNIPILFCFFVFFPTFCLSQSLPKKVSEILDTNYKGWQLIENRCDEKRAVFVADFNRDSHDDFVVQFLYTKKDGTKTVGHTAFYSQGSDSDFITQYLFEEACEGRGLRLAFELIPAGTDLKLNPPFDLTKGGARVYVCDTDEFYLWRIEKGRLVNGYNRYFTLD